MFRLATLLRKENSLDVCVEEQEFENKQKAKSIMSNNPDQKVVGMICFQDDRTTEEIIFDFATTYRAVMRLGKDEFNSCYYARYGLHLEPTIPTAFMTYFSKRV